MARKKEIRKQNLNRVNKWLKNKEESGIKPVTVYLPEDVRQSLSDLKEMQQLNQSEIVIAAVRDYFEKISDQINVTNYTKEDRSAGEMPFKKDDRVVVNNPRRKDHGKIGTVTGFSSKYNEVGIRFDEGGNGQIRPHFLDHVEELSKG